MFPVCPSSLEATVVNLTLKNCIVFALDKIKQRCHKCTLRQLLVVCNLLSVHVVSLERRKIETGVKGMANAQD